MKILFRILLLCVCVVCLVCCNYKVRNESKQMQKVIASDYKQNSAQFENVASKLINDENFTIYIDMKNIVSNGEETINSILTKEVFKENDGATLYELGYTKISKDYGGIYFYKYIKKHRSTGIMYYPYPFKETDNTLVKKYSLISDGWYYFEIS